jgi:hypothetical protein
VSGCSNKPRAPALEDDAVYHNAQAGLRFRVPDGWKQRAKADLPRGRIENELVLVEYMRRDAEGTALLELSVTDMPTAGDTLPFLAEASHGAGKWQAAGAAQQISVNGAAATRLTFTGGQPKAPMAKEVVVFRCGERTFLMTGVFKSTDKQAREQVRAAVASTIWRN